MSFNTSQLNPALVSAMNASQAGSSLASQQGYSGTPINDGAGFNAFHQAYQRLQSQESAKIGQQRLGLQPQQQQQQQPPQQQNYAQPADQNARLMAMMQQAQTMGMNGQGPGQALNLGSMAMTGSGMNEHSQQQGSNLQGTGENEQGRRQILQKCARSPFVLWTLCADGP